MKPLSEEELSKSAWEDYLNCQVVDDDAINAYIYGYKRGYAKCIKQMQDGFNELLVACNTSMNRLRWISVEDKLPEEGELVYAIREGNVEPGIYKFMAKDQWEWAPRFIACIDDITHWMPLPKPPKKGGEQ